jgi:hypothetical protein
MLVDDGICLLKLFLHMSDEEQLRRFRERITTPAKHWKMTRRHSFGRARPSTRSTSTRRYQLREVPIDAGMGPADCLSTARRAVGLG